jgi:adenylyl-sulfate kinase
MIRSANVTWQDSVVAREQRWRALGQHGATVWFTGLPGAGKSTIAAAVEAHMIESGRSAYRLDGDNMRHGICSDLGFSPEDRAMNTWRVGQVARLFADAGTLALVSLISPYASCREGVRDLHARDSLRFLEVFVNTSSEECARRDPKGLYARARAGSLSGLTGIDAPYEPPADPDIELTPGVALERAVEIVLEAAGYSL